MGTGPLELVVVGPRRRGRPIVRTAVVGGAAYTAGKSVQRGREQDAAQDQQLADAQAQQTALRGGLLQGSLLQV